MSNSNSNQTNEQPQPDPLAIALEEINRFDRARLNGDLVAERYDVAALRTAYATASELRAIRNLLTAAYTQVQAELEASRDDA